MPVGFDKNEFHKLIPHATYIEVSMKDECKLVISTERVFWINSIGNSLPKELEHVWTGKDAVRDAIRAYLEVK